jgi:hypothetical protein
MHASTALGYGRHGVLARHSLSTHPPVLPGVLVPPIMPKACLRHDGGMTVVVQFDINNWRHPAGGTPVTDARTFPQRRTRACGDRDTVGTCRSAGAVIGFA